MTLPPLSSLMRSLILAGLCSLSSLSHAQANLSTIYAGDEPVFEAYLLEGEFPPEGLKESSIFNTVYEKTYYATPLHPEWKQGTFAALQYFADMIGPNMSGKPAQVFIVGMKQYDNASAALVSTNAEGRGVAPPPFLYLMNPNENDTLNTYQPIKQDDIPYLTWNNQYQLISQRDKKPLSNTLFSIIRVGDSFGATREGAASGWWSDPDTLLPTNEQSADLAGAMRHEFGHALGILSTSSYYDQQYPIADEYPNYPYKALFDAYFFNTDPVRTSNYNRRGLQQLLEDPWNKHLVDMYGNSLEKLRNKRGEDMPMFVLHPEEFGKLHQFWEENKGSSSEWPEPQQDDFFIVGYTPNLSYQVNPNAPFAYFKGEQVSQVLQATTSQDIQGIPINGFESFYDLATADLSHIQLGRLLMSHEKYANVTTFSELELAAMQDFGWPWDRKAYYGYSLYQNHKNIINTQGYFARNSEGTAYTVLPSTIPLGVGLDIYGSYNTVTQKADIKTQGDGAVGIRLAGVQNHLILDQQHNVQADGYRGIGLLVNYGNHHIIEQNGAIQALGEQGQAARFDFGSSSIGWFDIYEGSYIAFQRASINKDGKPTLSGNYRIDKYPAFFQDVESALVTQYTVRAPLLAQHQAIYIGRNAFVENIRLEKGAKLQGDILSEWKHFDTDGTYDAATATADPPTEETPTEPQPESQADKNTLPKLPRVDKSSYHAALKIQYNGHYANEGYDYLDYIPDLVTHLRIATGMSYDGNITGPDNMKLHIEQGTFQYQGQADVVSVAVDPGARLLGGAYTLRNMTDGSYTRKGKAILIHSDFQDEETGVLINRGTIGAGADGSSLVIHQGNLDSREGTLLYTAIGVTDTAPIQVLNGHANIDKATVLMAAQPQYTPLSDYTVLDAKTISGKASLVVQGLENNQTGLLSGALVLNSADGETATARGASTTDNTLTAPNTIAIRFTPSNNLGNGSSAIQNDTFKAITATLTANNAIQLAPLYNLNRAQAKATLTDIYGGLRADMGNAIKFDRFPVDTMQSRLDDTHAQQGAWVVLDQTKGTLNRRHDLTKVHTDTHHFAIGLDRQLTPNWLVGGVFSYGHHKLTNHSASGKAEDWRFNLYARYGQPYHLNWDMYMGYGWQDHSVNRHISYLSDRIYSDYDSHLFSAGTRVSKLLPLGQTGWGLRPYLGVDVARYSQEAYTEKSREKKPSYFAQEVKHQTDTLVTTSLGAKLTKTFSDKGAFSLGVAYRRLLTGENNPLTVYHSPTVTQRIHGQGIGKNILGVDVQGNVFLGKNTLLQARLGGEFARGVRQYNGQMNLLWRF